MQRYIRAALQRASYEIDSDGSTFGAIDIAPNLSVSAWAPTLGHCVAALEQALCRQVQAALEAQHGLPPIDGLLPVPLAHQTANARSCPEADQRAAG